MRFPASFTPGKNTTKPAPSRPVPSPLTRTRCSSPPNATAPATPHILKILDAEQQLFPDENALARTQLNQLLIIVKLYKSLGGGWNQPETPAPDDPGAAK